jgi:hypothetical protein
MERKELTPMDVLNWMTIMQDNIHYKTTFRVNGHKAYYVKYELNSDGKTFKTINIITDKET